MENGHKGEERTFGKHEQKNSFGTENIYIAMEFFQN